MKSRLVFPLPLLKLADSKSLEMERQYIPMPIISANCFSVSNFLTPDECTQLINETSKIGYVSVAGEYPREHRNNFRVLVRSEQLADALYERVKSHFRRSDIQNAHPYGFDNSGVWLPAGMNDVFKFSFYSGNASFAPHYDGCFVVSNELRSIFTLLVYLNDDFQGGETQFQRTQQVPEHELYYSQVRRHEKIVSPVARMALVFNHDIMHSSQPLKVGRKYVLKTEIIFRRSDWSTIPSQLTSYKKDPSYQQATSLYALSDELEKKGDVSRATSAYLQAVAIQAKYKTYPKHTEGITQTFTPEIFAIIFSYVDIKTAVLCTQVNREWFRAGTDGVVWFRLFSLHFPTLLNLENRRDSEQKAFLKDWYNIYKTCYLLKNTEHPAICFDIGGCNFNFCIADSDPQNEVSIVGYERHPHYSIVGGGMTDAWKAGNEVSFGGNISPHFRPFAQNSVRDWHGLWVLVKRAYEALNYPEYLYFHSRKKDKKEKYSTHLHPVLLAEGHIPFDKEKLYHLMYDLLEVPALCVMDSSILALYSIGSTTGVVVDCGKDNIVCTPVWNGAILKNNIKTYGIASKKIVKFYCSVMNARKRFLEKYEVMLKCRVNPQAIPEESITRKVKETDALVLAPEVLFNARILSSFGLSVPPEAVESNSIVDFVYDTIMECGEDKRNELFNNVLLCGGLANMTGFIPRFEKEIREKRKEIKIRYTNSPSRTVIEGAKLFASSSLFPSLCFNRFDYLASAKKPPTQIAETKVVGELSAKFQHLIV